MISHYNGTGDAALYGVAYNLAMVLSFISSAINNSYVPWFYGKLKTNMHGENRRISLFLSMLLGSLILLVIWFAPEILSIMAGKQYAKAVYVVPPVAMSLFLAFYSNFSNNIEFYFEEKWYLTFASIWAGILNIVLNAIFLPRFGFIAAAYTTLFSYFVFTAFNYIAMFRILKKRNIKESGVNMKWLILLFIIFSFLSFTGMFLYDFPIVRISIAIVGMIVLLLHRKKVMDILQLFKTTSKNLTS